MKIAQFSDLHYCEKHLQWVDQAFAFATNDAIKREALIGIISGDSFDASIQLHEPAVHAFLRRVQNLANAMPVICLQGTFSHDRPGSLDVLKVLGSKYPIFVADRICQVAYTHDEGWVSSNGFSFEPGAIPAGTVALFSVLPSINKGSVAASGDIATAGERTGELIYDLCLGWAPTNLSARSMGIPTSLVTHGTVNGSMTECAQALVSKDHEFTAGTLFASQASAILVGHIHAHQHWAHEGRVIAYPGSITKLIHGHAGDTGYLLWDVESDCARFEFITTPAKRLLQVDFDGLPDIDQLAALAADADGAHVRIRFSVDEEHRHAVDKAAIKAMFAKAAECKIEGRVNPIQRTRSEGINRATTLGAKIERWCSLTGTEHDPLLQRLAMLEHLDPEAIVRSVLETRSNADRAA